MMGIGLFMTGAPAKTWYVATNGNDATHNGTSGWDQAYATISNAVTNAATSDMILVSNGTHNLTAEIYLDKAVTVKGFSTNREETIINCGGTVRGFFVNHSSACVMGLMVTNGFSSDKGGGISCENGVVSNCVIKWNTANRGGGLYLINAQTAYDCDIVGNLCTNRSSYGGGGIYSYNGNLTRCFISGNTSRYLGGGVWFSGNMDIPIMRDCVLSNNYAFDQGGGVSFSFGIITNCTVMGNSGNNGGGVSIGSGTMANCLVANNVAYSASYGGGGVYLTDSAAKIKNCRIVGNSTTHASCYGGGGVFGNNTKDSCALRNCLVWGNSSKDGGGIYLYQCAGLVQCCTVAGNTAGNRAGGVLFNGSGYLENTVVCQNTGVASTNWQQIGGANLDYATNCCIAPTNGLDGANNIAANPLFKNPAAGNYRLGSGSRCINAGFNQDWMTNTVDLDGNPRIVSMFGTNVDMGAYEYFVPKGSIFSYH